MTEPSAFIHFATYNQWMNQKLYNAAAVISDEHLFNYKGAFFKSIFGTLNHIVVADLIWLKRIAKQFPDLVSLHTTAELPSPTSLDQQLGESIGDLTALRRILDETLMAFCQELSSAILGANLEYTSTKGIKSQKRLCDVLLHVFNHQTHHRGQATTLFSQVGVDVGATDLILVMPNTPQT